jgi:hypothetical protein
VDDDLLLGEFRAEGPGMEGELVPALKVTTATGEVVKVPVSEIVEFKKKPAE